MRTMLAAALASVACLGVDGSALAAEATTPKPIVVKEEITLKATVVAIDQTNRTVTLKGEKGNVVNLTVDEGIKRFSSMKVGDIVTARYYESVAYDIKKPGTPAAPDTITEQAGKMTGEKPGRGLKDVSVTTVTITAIDAATPAITVRGSDGQIMNFRVRHPEYLKEVKVGDVVVVTKTEALMIGVDGPQ